MAKYIKLTDALDAVSWDTEAYTAINMLDTVEIIRCKDCVLTDGHEPIADGRYWCMLHRAYMYYCSAAERRTDEA